MIFKTVKDIFQIKTSVPKCLFQVEVKSFEQTRRPFKQK